MAGGLRAEAVRTGRSFKDTINDLLRLALGRRPSPRTRPFSVRARDLGAREGVELDNIGELIEQVEGRLHR